MSETCSSGDATGMHSLPQLCKRSETFCLFYLVLLTWGCPGAQRYSCRCFVLYPKLNSQDLSQQVCLRSHAFTPRRKICSWVEQP